MKTMNIKLPLNPATSGGDEMSLDDVISCVEPIIAKWDVGISTYAEITSLFTQSSGDEVSFYLDAVSQLHQFMQCFVADVSTVPSVRRDLIFAQTLMEMAMKRLKMEFYQILRTQRHTLRSITTSHDDSDNSDAMDGHRFSDMAMGNLRAIAECMISCGYTTDCLNIYRLERKSIVDEVIDRVVYRDISLSRIQKYDWESIKTQIENWLVASKIEVKNLFSGERILSDYVFGTSSPYQIKEPCFTNVTRDVAVRFFQFPELVASMMMAKRNKKTKKNKKAKNEVPVSDKMFHILDLYKANYDLAHHIQTIFSYNSTAAVRLQSNRSLEKLGESMRTLLSEFEYTVERDTSNGLVPGGGVHPLARRTLDFLVKISEYDTALSNIFLDQPLSPSASPDREPTVSGRLSWLLLMLQCKINGKAKVYSNVSLLYIFLANNLKYMITKVKESKLYQILGSDWVAEKEKILTSFLKNYGDAAWGRVASALAEENVTEFNSEFRDAWQLQAKWVAVEEGNFRDEIIATVKRKVLVPYQELYRKRTNEEDTEDDVVRFAPEDVLEYIKCIFRGDTIPLIKGHLGSNMESDRDYYSSGSGSGSYSNKFMRT